MNKLSPVAAMLLTELYAELNMRGVYAFATGSNGAYTITVGDVVLSGCSDKEAVMKAVSHLRNLQTRFIFAKIG